MSEPIVVADRLLKRYGDRVVLREISLTIEPGAIVALVGPSGGGKSTMLRCLIGLAPFEGGAVTVAGVALPPGPLERHAAAIRALHGRAGMVFQQWHLFPHRSAVENVMEAPIHVRGVAPAKARAEAEALLAKVGLAHRANAMPRSMSGGEQQRCAIARALAMEPKILFMDEPTSALDPQRVGELADLLAMLRDDDGLTIVLVTHEMRFARELASRALVLHEGRVVEDGDPNVVLVDPKDANVRAFLGLGD